MDWSLTAAQRRALVDHARAALAHAVRRGQPLRVPAPDEALTAPGAAFVTLEKHGELRGCIGHVEAREPLWDCVADMARAAALSDARFPPVEEAELADIEIELSLLTPLERIQGPEDVVVGRDGLVIERGYHRGLLLPQVAAERGWSREEFVGYVCMKAGLSIDAWMKPDARLYRFQALVFHDDGPDV